MSKCLKVFSLVAAIVAVNSGIVGCAFSKNNDKNDDQKKAEALLETDQLRDQEFKVEIVETGQNGAFGAGGRGRIGGMGGDPGNAPEGCKSASRGAEGPRGPKGKDGESGERGKVGSFTGSPRVTLKIQD